VGLERVEQAEQAERGGEARGRVADGLLLLVVLALALGVTGVGFRSGAPGWMLAAVAQFIVVGSWAGRMSATAAWTRGHVLGVLGLEVPRVFARVVIEAYLALLLALPFLTVFDDWAQERW